MAGSEVKPPEGFEVESMTPPEGFTIESDTPPTPEGILERFGKQLYNQGIAGTIKGVARGIGGGRVMATVAAPFLKYNAAKAGRDISLREAERLLGGGLISTGEEIAYGLGGGRVISTVAAPFLKHAAAEAGKDTSLLRAQQLIKIGMLDGTQVPTPDLSDDRTLGEKIADTGAGFAVMAAQIAFTKKTIPGISTPMAWEVQSLANGGEPGHGYILGLLFHGVNKIPAKKILGKAGKQVLETGALAGLVKLEGGTWEDVAIVTATAGALKTPGAIAGLVRGKPGPMPALPKIAADPDQVYKAPLPADKLPFVEATKPKPSTTSSRLTDPVAAESDDSYFMRSMWSQVRDAVPGKPVVPTPQSFKQALVNRHIALYQGFEKAKPGGPIQKQLSDDIYDTTKALNMLDGVTDPVEGRQFVPPEYTKAKAPRPPASLGTLPEAEGAAAARVKAFDEAQAKARASRTQQEEADAWFKQYKEQPAQVPGRPAPAEQPSQPSQPDEFDAFMARGNTPEARKADAVTKLSEATGRSVDDVAYEYNKQQAAQPGELQSLTAHERQIAKLVGVPDTNPPTETRQVLELAGRLTPQELGNVRDAAGTPDALHKALVWAKNTGALPDDPQARAAYVSTTQEAASRLKAGRKEGQKRTISMWQTVDKVLDRSELEAGAPLRDPYHGMVAARRQAGTRAVQLVRGMLDQVVDRKKVRLSSADNEAMRWWLFNGDPERWKAMSPDARRVALTHRSLLSVYAADRLRAFRFDRWEKYGIVPDDVPKADQTRILAEGLDARNKGTFDEWIGTQEWGTRKTYYMSASEESMGSIDDLINPTGMAKGVGERGPGTDLRAAHGRRGISEPIEGDVTENVIRHVASIDTALALKDSMPKFWENFQRSNPTKADSEIVRNFLTNVAGKYRNTAIDAEINKYFPHFWRAYFLNPLKNLWFSTRNLGTFTGLGPSQLRAGETAKALTRMATDRAHDVVNEQRAKHWQEDYAPRISQDLDVFLDSLVTDGSLPAGFKTKYYEAARKAGELAMLSEKGVRTASWSVSHQIAQTAMEELAAGKIDVAKVRGRLMLDSMLLSQRAELDNLMTTGNSDMFIRRYAEYKTDAINFSYDIALRSALEQSPTGRAFAGIMVFPRGAYNIAVTNGLVPIYRGWQKGNYRQMDQGIRNIVMLAIGASVTDWVYEQATGKKAAWSLGGLFTYSPGAPGYNMIADTWRGISLASYRHSTGQTTTKQEAFEIVAALAKPAEFAFPLSDAIVRLHAISTDTEDVRLWGLVRAGLDEKYAQGVFKKHERTAYQNVMHLLFGGFNEEEKDEVKTERITR